MRGITLSIFATVISVIVLLASLYLSAEIQLQIQFNTAEAILQQEKIYSSAYLKSAELACARGIDSLLLNLSVSYSNDALLNSVSYSCSLYVQRMKFSSPEQLSLAGINVTSSPSGISYTVANMELLLTGSYDGAFFTDRAAGSISCLLPLAQGQNVVRQAALQVRNQLALNSLPENRTVAYPNLNGSLQQVIWLTENSSSFQVTLSMSGAYCSSPGSWHLVIIETGTLPQKGNPAQSQRGMKESGISLN